MNAPENVNLLNAKTIKTNTIFSRENLRLVALLLLTVIATAIISLAINDPSTYYKNTFLYTVSILFFIFVVFVYIINGFDKNAKGYIFLFIGISVAVIVTITLVFQSGLDTLLSNDYFTNSILLCIALIALAIIYYLFLEKMVTRPGWTSFIIKFIFYIPCLFTDGIKYLLQDFSSTPRHIFYLFFIEIILITIYLYFYPRLQKSVYENGVVLSKESLSLNKEHRIDMELYRSFANKKPLPGSKLEVHSPIRQTYSISMWVYLNNQPFTQYAYKKESTIFAYLDASGNGHPKITYKNNQQGLDQYVFYLTNYMDASTNTFVPLTHTMSLPHQKWNNIVLNYRDLYVDIFINGVLEISIPLKETPVFTNMDTITIGEKGINERTGLYGSVCNVVYYKNIMSKGQIVDNYNLLSIRNPPIN